MTHVDPANEQLDPLTKGVLGGIEYDGNGFELLWGWWTCEKSTDSEQDPGHKVLASQFRLDSEKQSWAHLESDMLWYDLNETTPLHLWLCPT